MTLNKQIYGSLKLRTQPTSRPGYISKSQLSLDKEHEEHKPVTKETRDLNPKFTPKLEATSPLRSSQRARLSLTLFSLNQPQRRIESLTIYILTKRRGNTNFLACSTNRLGRSKGDA
ncbi:unnamed protein product [Urochloa humidicola]